MIIKEWIIPYDRSTIRIHDLKYRLRAALKLHNDRLYPHTDLGEVDTNLRIENVWNPICHR